ncbi:Netrin-A [Gryllus bimaculatus]|nr:Netrin-A [Gryllus bimaculatus]
MSVPSLIPTLGVAVTYNTVVPMFSTSSFTTGYIPHRTHPCEQSSCYPATGNLLIGREARLWASSTCGLEKEERYCIVSHLEDRKKCFRCDSRDQYVNNPARSHRIENIVYKNFPGTDQRSWWQSENGVENVTIQLDLEAEFHFTHMIITFKTFRPAAMLIERSYDFGRSWQVYRYFAHNCDAAFPEVPKTKPTTLTDVVCESRYSNVAPSTGGEIIFRVLLPNLHIDDPYSPEVQNLLKMTNLRINFTKLHTLGDDLLDNRQEIHEKYYYAIYQMVVRGSCSCYGHASRCLPLSDDVSRVDMVHGRCECTHNTKGLNCEECEDFYNDLPWKPAFGKQTNACKRCNCNGHASSCHFDEAVYELTGRVSGGVCDDCQHNTMGRNCEQCRNFYYQDPGRDITDPEICQLCDCDPRGSLDDGICDSRTDPANGLESGRCHCKTNVDGRRCDRCKNGFWNFQESNPDGCQSCTCNTLGTVNNQGCNVYTGECTCKRYVHGRDCNQCLLEYWGLSDDPEGCKPCDCDPGGSFDNRCDVITGQCRCRPHVTGRACDQPEQSYFTGSLDYLVYEAELARGSDVCREGDQTNLGSQSSNCQVVIREPFRDGRENTWTGTGFMRTFENSDLEFTVDNIQRSMEYDIVIRYEPQLPGQWDDVRVTVERDGPVDQNGPCARSATVYPPVCLEAGRSYKVRLEFKRYNNEVDSPSASILVDSIALIPRIESIPFFEDGSPANELRRQEFERYHCGQYFQSVSKGHVPEICNKYHYNIGFYVYGGAFSCECDPTGSLSSLCAPLGGLCQCKPNVVGRKCDRCAPGTYGFGPEGCKGKLCIEGFYGDPRIGASIPCRPCPCPGTRSSGHSFATHCSLDPITKDVVCECDVGYAGSRCDVCADNYFGDPEVPGGSCRACNCSKNIDISRPGNCDGRSGECLQCLFNTEGFNCHVCRAGYYGDAINQECRECVCNLLGTNSSVGFCDRQTGQCPCLPNVIGQRCDECAENHWKIASGTGCEPCDCDPIGSVADQCNLYDGQCSCRPGFGGRKCNECQANFWGNPTIECHPCQCDLQGSATQQCDRATGHCICIQGIGGAKCDECARGYLGDAPYCSACGECFDNWDRILNELKGETNRIIDQASKINQTGATGAYTFQFESMEKKLADVSQLLENTTVSYQDLAALSGQLDGLRDQLNKSNENVIEADSMVKNSTQRVLLANATIELLRERTNMLKGTANALKENATQLQEANVEGALNLTRKFEQVSLKAQDTANGSLSILQDVDRNIRRVEHLVAYSGEQQQQELEAREQELIALREQLAQLEEEIPELNHKVCGQPGNPCDSVCGGAGCGRCGGIACLEGAVSKANEALQFARKAEEEIRVKEQDTEALLRTISQAKQVAVAARDEAKDAYDAAFLAHNQSDTVRAERDKFLEDYDQFLNEAPALPSEIRAKATEALEKNIKLEPQQITDLAQRINETIASLTDIDTILEVTAKDLADANELKDRADEAKQQAEGVLSIAEGVVSALEEAREAQDKADEAIQKADDDIRAAQSDLAQIGSETAEAQSKAHGTVDAVNGLQERLRPLQSLFWQNSNGADQVVEEAKKLEEEANRTQEDAKDLLDKFKLAQDKLTQRANNSEAAHSRAERLIDRLNRLQVELTEVITNLQTMEKEYVNNENKLNNLSDEIDNLLQQMIKYSNIIDDRASFYRECVP